MKKGLETYLYTTVGVLAFLAIIIAVNIIGSRAKVRVDLTSERAYTLSAGTRAILAKLDTPVQIRFYCTRGENSMPVFLKNYAQSVEDLLGEFRQASKGQIEIQKLDPKPDSDAEDSAKLDGVEGQMVEMGGEALYLGVSVTMLDQKEAIPFLDPNRQKLLEYDLARAVSRVMTPSKPVVGVMSSLPVNGSGNPMMMRMGRGGEPAWTFVTELKRDFTVKTVEMTADKIPDDVKVLLVIHPKGITDSASYAIDQFVLRGGKLIAYLDPLAALDRAAGGPMGGASSSSMEKLMKAWGISFDSTKVVADMNYISRMRQGRSPAVLSLTANAVNKDDLLTASADNLFFVFGGAFSGSPAEGLRQTAMIKSSTNSQLIDPMSAQMGGEQLVTDFKASGTEYALAVRLEGKFKTAFPEGKPKAPEPKPEDGKPPEEKKPDAPAEAGLKESAEQNVVILIGDSDFIQDQACVQEAMNPFGGGQRMMIPTNGNLAFAQAGVEQLSGDSNLIAVRSRASRERPFTVVKKMQADAEAAFQSKIKELESSLRETQTKLNDLQRSKAGEGGQKFILSAEQQAEIANFRKKEADSKVQLKKERKNLRNNVESLETKTKWMNILVMPALVTAAGIFLALKRRKLQAAR